MPSLTQDRPRRADLKIASFAFVQCLGVLGKTFFQNGRKSAPRFAPHTTLPTLRTCLVAVSPQAPAWEGRRGMDPEAQAGSTRI